MQVGLTKLLQLGKTTEIHSNDVQFTKKVQLEMTTSYQIILLGRKEALIPDILEASMNHIQELGVKKESIVTIDSTNFKAAYKGNAPAFCLYFGNESGDHLDQDLLKVLITDATLILPIVSDIKKFIKSIPKDIQNINGFELRSKVEIEALVGLILEGLSLLRLSRRLFISYKRDESTTVAIQLFERLEKGGFDVFLDTHSVRPGEPFQEELWHRLADTDVVVLLNTPGFLSSNWTTQELAQANSMSIGILQLIWPNHKQEREAELSVPINLTELDFNNKIYTNSKSYLSDQAMDEITSKVESLRARSLAARQDNIVTEFIKSSVSLGITADLQSEKFIVVKRNDGKEIVIIPTVGVPQAFTYHQCEELVAKIKSQNVIGTYLLYDHINIRKKWIEHLAWLDQYLKVKTIKLFDVHKRLAELVNH